MATFDGFYASLDPDVGVKGKQFEIFVKWFLKTDPTWATQVDEVWIWNEYPKRWGADCNEMINCSGKKVFKDYSQIYLEENNISQQLDYHYGERVNGTHINNLIRKSIIDKVFVFNFDYRVIR